MTYTGSFGRREPQRCVWDMHRALTSRRLSDIKDNSVKMFVSRVVHLSWDIHRLTQISQGDILCDLPIPLIARTTFTAGGDPTTFQTVLDGTYYDREVLVDTPDAPTAIPFASNITTVLQYFGYGLALKMAVMSQLNNGSYPTKVAGYLVNPDWCPVSFFGKDPDCRNDSFAQPRFRWGVENLVFDNGSFATWGANVDRPEYYYDSSENTTYTPTVIFSEQLRPATFNLMNAFLSAVRTDIGGARANNMFQSREALAAQIYANPFEDLFAPSGYFTAQEIEDSLNNDPYSRVPIPEAYRQPTRMVINYLCTKQELKRGAVLVFNVAVAAFALFGTIWGLTMMVASMALQQRKDWKGTCKSFSAHWGPLLTFPISAGVCLGHSQSNHGSPDSSYLNQPSYIQQQYYGPPSSTPGYSTIKEQTPFFSQSV